MKKVNRIQWHLALVFSSLLVACSPESRDLYPTYPEPEQINPPSFDSKKNLTGEGQARPNTTATPQVDILFVVDNSLSMIQEIEDATKDIYRFIDVFTKTNQVDYHIGVTTVWDSVRYSSSNQQREVDQFVKDANGKVLKFKRNGLKTVEVHGQNEEIANYIEDPSGAPLRNFWSRGELLPIRNFDDASNRYLRAETAKRFISNADGSNDEIAEALKQLLSVEVIGYEYQKTPEGKQCRPQSKEKWEKHYCTDEELATLIPGSGRGPEIEEIFSPIQAALTEPRLLNGPNKGFFRRSAFKVVVILSDADDSSMNISAEQLKFHLENSTDREEGHKVAVYAITPKVQSASCKFDNGLIDPETGVYELPTKIPELLRLFGDADKKSFDICKPFGEKLAEIGENVLQRTLAQTEIRLTRYPQVSEESVRSELEIPESLAAGDLEVFPELDCHPELLQEVFNQLGEPLEETETADQRMQAVGQYVRAKHTPLPFAVTNWGPSWLRVCYGRQRVPVYDKATGLGYTWDRDRSSIKIRGAELMRPIPGGVFSVHAKELDLLNRDRSLFEYEQ